jgi:hypothetical protein
MRRYIFLPSILLCLALLAAGCQTAGNRGRIAPLPSAPAADPGTLAKAVRIADYTIAVTLDPAAKLLTGRESITYRNTTPHPITSLTFHLYLNAFRDLNSTFLKESGSQSRGFAWDAEHPGWIRVTALRLANGTPLNFEPVGDDTIGYADLPAPVVQGQALELEVEFQAQLPKVFARTGFASEATGNDFFMVGQWFPKLGVWENGAWEAEPFHANAEFYADFGVYNVAITLPTGYVTGGCGLPTGAVDNGDGTQTVTYHAEPVIDFAWTASPHFQTAARQVGSVEVVYLYLPEHAWTVARVLDAAEAAVVYFGAWYGPYPYPRLTVVDVPDDGGGAGGMEYPTLVTAGAEDLLGMGGPIAKFGFDHGVEVVTVHEIGHQWFQSMVATNEGREPWLDEGFTDYISVRGMAAAYGPTTSAFQAGTLQASYLDMRRMEYLANPGVAMHGAAWDFPGMMDYGVATYSKPVMALTTLENVLGSEAMLQVMSTYFSRYQFRHPTTTDFRQVAEEVSGQDLAWFFDGVVYGSGSVNYTVESVTAHQATLTRTGDLELPVEILVTFSDGSTRLETWTSQDYIQVLDYPNQTIDRVQIDPQRKLVLDLDWSDNGRTRQADLNAWLALDVRMLYSLQNALLALGGY